MSAGRSQEAPNGRREGLFLLSQFPSPESITLRTRRRLSKPARRRVGGARRRVRAGSRGGTKRHSWRAKSASMKWSSRTRRQRQETNSVGRNA